MLRVKTGERKKLEGGLHLRGGSGRIFTRAMILRLLDRGKSLSEVAADVGASPMGVRQVGNRYLSGGLDRALWDAPRPGKQALLNNRQEKEIVALACSAPPGERARWTIELLREEVLRRGIAENIS